jgi:hypothetical protein
MRLPALLWEWPAALFAHVFVALAIWLVSLISVPAAPLFKPDDVMVISMSGPPKSTGMVQKAERAPDAVRGAANPTAEPPPPNSSDMAYQTPDAKMNKGQTNADMQKILDDMKRQQLLKDLSAPLGTQDRAASDPNGSGDGSTASSGINDPETAKWIKKMQEKVAPNWHPIMATCQANPKLTVFVTVPMLPDGSLDGDLSIETSSGNASLDQSALRAVQQTTNLPPPPAKFTSGVNGRVKFACSEVI